MDAGLLDVLHHPAEEQFLPVVEDVHVDLVEVQVELRHAVRERVRPRHVAAMAHHAFVHGAVQGRVHADGPSSGQPTPSPAATSTALRMPSSWKPQPQ